MKIVAVETLAIAEVKVIRFGRFGDHRGYFTEPFRRSDIDARAEFLGGIQFPQSNESYSHANVVRGLHFQWNPYMGKLVRTIAGHMVDLVLDIRQGSPTYGKIIAHDMPAAADRAEAEWIWVPPGFAHGNFFLEPSYIEYYCSGEYSPGCEAGISPLAEDLDWSLCAPALKAQFDRVARGAGILSDKDRQGLSLTAWGADPRAAHFHYGCC